MATQEDVMQFVLFVLFFDTEISNQW